MTSQRNKAGSGKPHDTGACGSRCWADADVSGSGVHGLGRNFSGPTARGGKILEEKHVMRVQNFHANLIFHDLLASSPDMGGPGDALQLDRPSLTDLDVLTCEHG